MSRDAEKSRRAYAQAAADPAVAVCPDCDGTGRGHTSDWPYDQQLVTCRRCHGDGTIPTRSLRS